jgi:prolyl-tRNA synthetase
VLEEPLVVRPTSETIIGDAFSRWIKSHRDLPLLINQWANVVRWEMRTRLFLRTSEFLWQEGHTAHADEKGAREETIRMLGVYRDFAQDTLAIPVIEGEKPENERFPGAVNTYSIEAMMQDGKALQAGTSHYLGQNFARAQNIRFQNDAGELAFCHTTSWGLSTRMVGGVVMTHGDDDGLRLPPAIAPRQVVIVPMLRDKPEDAQILEYGEKLTKALTAETAFGERVRVLFDTRSGRSAEKRWNWVRRGAPVIVEIGPRDANGNVVTFMRRDTLRDGDKVRSQTMPQDAFVKALPGMLSEIQEMLFHQAKAMLNRNIVSGITNFHELSEFFGEGVDEDEGSDFKGWVRAPWARPTGDALDAVEKQLKQLKLTLRNVPMKQPSSFGKCIFTGNEGVEEILIARAY